VLGTEPVDKVPERVRGVALTDGRQFSADIVVVGIGAVPCDELARAAGLACENGIVVDEHARTSDAAIYAVGDVTWRMLPHYDNRRFRLESVPNALEQARHAACAITGRPAPPEEVPWFWSDQYDVKLQIAGIPFGATTWILRGDVKQAKFAVFHMAGDRVVAVEAVNSAAEFMIGKQLIANRRPVSPIRLQDSAISMRAITNS
jgi:3-phenylpropionate/trans-cinnamate dioxygenase ferredoxin reductase subunit